MTYVLVRTAIWLALRCLFPLFGGLRIIGRDQVPRKGGVIIAANHISDCDPAAIGMALPRRCWFMAKQELFEMPLVGWVVRTMHGLPVRRWTADHAALQRSIALLKSGQALVVFPEGKISEDGYLQPFSPGVMLLAAYSGAPIVPALVLGTDGIMPYGKTRPQRSHGPAIVEFGAPCTLDSLAPASRGAERYRAAAEALRDVLIQMGGRVPADDAQ
ncbi:MAG: 1-acyl-sn-glycerol-3-phosphate acyltransferase [Armatimonadetes bacterium]|nr:1-acyl-sn-glycerol-3-phosphate acyltransferase [Armatimonadota bacterium]MDE2205314.1 1-acyl-sn-glycerol-3-phosphate acyltransferase [Armatimonadota bacterium]